MVELNHLCNLGRRHDEEYFCEVDQWFKTCHLKTVLISSSGCPFVPRCRMICAILVENILKTYFLSGALAVPILGRSPERNLLCSFFRKSPALCGTFK